MTYFKKYKNQSKIIPFLTSFLILFSNLNAQTLKDNLWVTDDVIRSIIKHNDQIFIGGYFSYVGPVTGCGAVIDSATGNHNAAFPEVNDAIRVVIPDGSGGCYIGGNFTEVGGLARNRIARINADNSVHAWDPNAGNNVYAMALEGSNLYIGGQFTTVGGQTRNRLAAIDTLTGTVTAWNPNASSTVNCITILDTAAYVGGYFSTINGQNRSRIAAIDLTTGTPTAWDPDIDGIVNAIAISGNYVYVGGDFSFVDTTFITDLAAVDLNTAALTLWDPNPGGEVRALLVSGNNVYAAGDFTSMNFQPRNRLAAIHRTSGMITSWDPDVNSSIYSLAISGSTIYAGGIFNTVGGQARRRIAAIDTTTGNVTPWSPHTDDLVFSVAASNAKIFAGGRFTSAGGEARNNIAAIDTLTGAVTSWDPDITGGLVEALDMSGSTIYAGGNFTQIGGQARRYLGAIDIPTGNVTAWDPNVTGGSVYALSLSDSNVYVGGDFNTIGAISRNGIAAIDTGTGIATSWDPNVTGGRVFDIKPSGSNVYIGGAFNSVSTQTRNFLAAIDISTGSPTTWNPDVIGTEVYVLEIEGPNIYVGGSFSFIGGQLRSNIAAVDTLTGLLTAWNPNSNGIIHDLLISGSNIYSCGFFSNIGGSLRNRIASINAVTGIASAWDPDADNLVTCLESSGSTIYFAGTFDDVGGNLRPYFAGVSADGIVLNPVLEFSTDTLYFPPTAVGGNTLASVDIINTGTSDLNINAKYLAGPNVNDFFSPPGGFPNTIVPGDTSTYSVDFMPTSTGLKYAYLVIGSDAASSPDTVVLQGLCSNAGLALSVDGTNYINCGNDTSLDVHDAFTVEVWVKGDIIQPPTANGYGRIVDKHQWSTQTGYGLSREPFTNSTLMDFYDLSGTQHTLLGQTPITDEQWHHIAATYDGNAMRMYIDGLLENTSIIGNLQVRPSTNILGIGANWDGANWQHFGGEIDEVRIWRVARSHRQIVSAMMDTLESQYYLSPDSGLIGYWRFNLYEDLGINGDGPDDVRDLTYNQNHGDANGNPILIPSAAFSGITLTPVLQFSSDSLSYPYTAVGSDFNFPITIYNNGTSDLNISMKSITGIDAVDFSIIQGSGASTIIPFDFEQIEIRFSPNSEGLKSAYLIIQSDASSSPDTVRLIGNATNEIGWFPLNSGTLTHFRSTHFINANTGWVSGYNGLILRTNNGGFSFTAQNSGTSNNLYSVYFVDENNGWALGEAGVIVHTSDGGNTWVLQTSGTTDWFYASFFIDTNIGWAVTNNGLILYTTDGGNNWVPQFSGTSSGIPGIYFYDNNNGWAVGDSGLILNTNDGGTNWVQFSSGTSHLLTGIRFIGLNSGWAVGDSGTILHTTDGGNTWIPQNSGISNRLDCIQFSDISTGWVAGENGIILYTDDGGNTWTPQNSGSTIGWRGLCFVDDSTGWAVGDSGTIIHTIDGGNVTPLPLLRFSSNSLNFPQTEIGIYNDIPISIYNNGTLDLNISSKDIVGANASEFSIFQGAGASTITSSDSEQVVIRFSPTSIGPKSAWFIVTSNSPSNPDTIQLIGNNLPIVQIDNTPVNDSDIGMTITPPQNYNPTITRLYYRMAGETNWQMTNLIFTGSDYTGNIDSSFTTIRGIEYYVYFDDGQTVITYPAVNPQSNPAVIQVQVDQMMIETQLFSEKYKMISFPLELADSTISSVFEDDYGTYNKKKWRILHWNDNQNAYDEYPAIQDPIEPGFACWLITHDALPFDVENGLSVHSDSSFSINIEPGWNQIANPFAFNVAWDSIANTQLLNNPVYWDGDNYDYTKTTLQPWEGYFIYNDTNNVTISVPPIQSGIQLTKPTIFNDINSQEFIVQIIVTGKEDNQSDGQNFVGMLHSSLDGFDVSDYPQAPAIIEKLELSITDKNKYFAGNFKSISNEGAYWELQLSNIGKNKNVQIEVNNISDLPDNFETWLLDLDKYKPLPIKNDLADVKITNTNNKRNLRLIIGTEEYAKQVSDGIPLQPVSFALFQNYPNPFNPNTIIKYQLAERIKVRLEIFNILGQKIKTLVQTVQNTGLHQVVWDGKNDNGKQVSSSVFIYRIKADSFNKTRKMILIR